MEQQVGSKPKTIRTTKKTTFTGEIATKEESIAMQAVSNINGIDVEVTVNTALGINKGFVYIYGYNMVEFKSFKEGLTKQYGLSSVINATWNESKRANCAKPLLLTLTNELSLYLDIPGEMMRTKVLEYKQRPLICRKCMEYGHGKNQCDREQTCSRCGMSGHGMDGFHSDEINCFHCEGNHEAGSNLCAEYKYQKGILSIQAKERVSRH